MKRIIIIFALTIASSISVFSQMSDKKLDKTSKAKEQVTTLVTEFANALVKGDTVAMERILSDDFADASNFLTTKKLVIDYFKVNANNASIGKLVAIDLDNSVAYIRVYDNVAVMVIPTRVKWRTPKNQPEEGSYLATVVAYNKQGQWQIVATHYSEYKVEVSQPRPQ